MTNKHFDTWVLACKIWNFRVNVFLNLEKKRTMRVMFLYTFLLFVNKFRKRVCCYTMNEVTCFWSLCGFELFNLDFSKFRITYVSQGKSKVKRFLFMKNLRFYILKYIIYNMQWSHQGSKFLSHNWMNPKDILEKVYHIALSI